MTRNDLAQMSREELIDLVLAHFQQGVKLAEQNAQLQVEIEALRLKLEKGRKPPTNSGNSSQPPSRDQKGNLLPKRKKNKHGPPTGHVKYEREFVAEPDHVVEIKPEICQQCQADLRQAVMVLADITQITELPVAKAEVIEVRQYKTDCACCGASQMVAPPAGLEMERMFGARLEATVVYYRQEQHMSYVRTQAALRNLHAVEISQGGIDKIMQRAVKKALQEVKAIEADIRHSALIYSDETGGRVDGNTWWQWVFCSDTAVLHVMRFNRSFDVIREVMGKHRTKFWVSDCYGAQMKAHSKKHQICLSHQIRNLQAVVERYRKVFWSRHVQFLFRYAIHLHNHRQDLSAKTFLNRVKRLEIIFDKLLSQELDQPEARRLQRRYQKFRNALFVFLYHPEVSPTNNISERYLRPSVIHRKVTGGFRSGWGAQGYAALKSLIDTAALTGGSPFVVIQNLFGTPALPLAA
jgi:transposase